MAGISTADDRTESLDTLRGRWRYALSRLKSDPNRAPYVPSFTAFGATWEAADQAERAKEDAVTDAEAVAATADAGLDRLVRRVSGALFGGKKVDVTLPVAQVYFGGVAPSDFMRPQLGKQLSGMASWPALLGQATQPALLARSRVAVNSMTPGSASMDQRRRIPACPATALLGWRRDGTEGRQPLRLSERIYSAHHFRQGAVMKIHYFGLAFSTLFFMACGAVDPEPEQASPQEATAETAQALRFCTSNLNCASGCECDANTCGPDGFGPPTPQSICDAPPQRHCSSQADCISGCNCVSNYCQYSGFSPPLNCLASPPDKFESDDTHQTASSYLGTPQLKHTFHRLGDVDWILVATPANQVLNVDAYHLGNLQKMRIEIYNYDYAHRSLGTLIGSTQSLLCNLNQPACLVFHATANVTAGSVYAVKVIDRRTGPIGDYDLTAPSYDLNMY